MSDFFLPCRCEIVIEIGQSSSLERRRYNALKDWMDALESTHNVVVSKIGPPGSGMGMSGGMRSDLGLEGIMGI